MWASRFQRGQPHSEKAKSLLRAGPEGAQFSWEFACLTRAKPESLSPGPQTAGMELHVCKHSTWEVEAGESEVHGQPQLHRELEASLGYLTRVPHSLAQGSRACLSFPDCVWGFFSR